MVIFAQNGRRDGFRSSNDKRPAARASPHHIRATNRPQLPLRYRRFSDRLLDALVEFLVERLKET